MGNILYVIAFFFIVLWGVGYFIFNAFWAIHLLLVIAFIAVILRVFQVTKKKNLYE